MELYSIIVHIMMCITLITFASFILHQHYNISMTKICLVLLIFTVLISTGVAHAIIP